MHAGGFVAVLFADDEVIVATIPAFAECDELELLEARSFVLLLDQLDLLGLVAFSGEGQCISSLWEERQDTSGVLPEEHLLRHGAVDADVDLSDGLATLAVDDQRFARSLSEAYTGECQGAGEYGNKFIHAVALYR